MPRGQQTRSEIDRPRRAEMSFEQHDHHNEDQHFPGHTIQITGISGRLQERAQTWQARITLTKGKDFGCHQEKPDTGPTHYTIPRRALARRREIQASSNAASVKRTKDTARFAQLTMRTIAVSATAHAAVRIALRLSSTTGKQESTVSVLVLRSTPLIFPLASFLSHTGRGRRNVGCGSERILATSHAMVAQAWYVPNEKSGFFDHALCDRLMSGPCTVAGARSAIPTTNASRPMMVSNNQRSARVSNGRTGTSGVNVRGLNIGVLIV